MILVDFFRQTPIHARVAPFVIFVALTACQGQLVESSRYWIYALKTILGAWMIWAVRPAVEEMKWKFSVEALLVGVGVFVAWVGLDSLYPKLSEAGKPWNPNVEFGEGSPMAMAVIATRILGSSLIVPPIEEIFYRSFIYRYMVDQDFMKVGLSAKSWKALAITAGVFGFAHHEWLAGILCGLAYQWLVLRKGRLGDAITAHAITNFLLGIWVVWKGAWNFW